MKRTCEFCEYFYISPTGYSDEGYCLFAPPKHINDESWDDFNSQEKARLQTRPQYKCREWEPRWDGDERISKEWEKFKTSYALMANHGE